jgi:hypothetical protein
MKEMLGWIREKWLFKHQPQEVAGFLPLVQPLLETVLQLTMTCAL